MTKPTLLIIGAGASGLLAARELTSFYEITILEANDRIGGRIFSLSHESEIIEAGAEFVHGNLPITLTLLKEAGIKPVKISGKMFRHEQGEFSAVTEMTDGWDDLLQKMEEVEEDMTMQELLMKFFSSPRYEALRRQVVKYLAGFDLADVARASVQGTLKEWQAEEQDNYRVRGGYQSLINYFHEKLKAEGVRVNTNTAVQKVRWEPGSVTLTTTTGAAFMASKVLVTVPISMLQFGKTSLQFEPKLPFETEIANDIGFGAVIKLVLKFKTPFWQTNAGFILSDEVFPTWWTQLPSKNPLMTGWVGGPAAAALSHLDDEELVTKGLSSLATLYNIDIAELHQQLEWAKVFNWQKTSYVNGGYSYAMIGTRAAQTSFSTPIEDTIFFAGEALYNGGHPGTVEAAFFTALEAAQHFKKNRGEI
ncbi:MAG: NAD(P)/FAD-dependent oxidoreductase [Bacteroidota bacterium]